MSRPYGIGQAISDAGGSIASGMIARRRAQLNQQAEEDERRRKEEAANRNKMLAEKLGVDDPAALGTIDDQTNPIEYARQYRANKVETEKAKQEELRKVREPEQRARAVSSRVQMATELSRDPEFRSLRSGDPRRQAIVEKYLQGSPEQKGEAAKSIEGLRTEREQRPVFEGLARRAPDKLTGEAVRRGVITPGQGQTLPQEPVRPSYERGQAEAEAQRRGLQRGTPEYFDFVTGKERDKTILTPAQVMAGRLKEVELNANLIWDQRAEGERSKAIQELGWSPKDYEKKDDKRKVVDEIVNARRLGFLDQMEAKARAEAGDNQGSLDALDRSLQRVIDELEAELQALRGLSRGKELMR